MIQEYLYHVLSFLVLNGLYCILTICLLDWKLWSMDIACGGIKLRTLLNGTSISALNYEKLTN